MRVEERGERKEERGFRVWRVSRSRGVQVVAPAGLRGPLPVQDGGLRLREGRAFHGRGGVYAQLERGVEPRLQGIRVFGFRV